MAKSFATFLSGSVLGAVLALFAQCPAPDPEPTFPASEPAPAEAPVEAAPAVEPEPKPAPETGGEKLESVPAEAPPAAEVTTSA